MQIKPRQYAWTEQQCKDAAMMSGLTEEEGMLYYLRYACRGWLDGAGVPIACVRLHMRLLKVTGGLPKSKKKVKQINERMCGCGEAATINVSGKDYCKSCKEKELGW
jgi:hypothetical protein